MTEFAEQIMDRTVARTSEESDNEDGERIAREALAQPRRTWVNQILPEQWRLLTKVLLLAVPHGLPARYTRELLQECLTNAELTEREMEILQRDFFCHICSELDAFLTDSTIEHLADRIGTDRVSLAKALFEEFRACEPTPQALAATVWEAFRAGDGEGALGVLKAAATDPEARRMLESGEVLDLLSQWPVTFFGQVGQRTTGSRSRVLEVEELADGIRKRVCFAIVAAGYPVVAVAGDHIVLEVHDPGTPGQDTIIMCVQEAVQGLRAAVPQEYRPRRNVPIVVEQEWGDQW